MKELILKKVFYFKKKIINLMKVFKMSKKNKNIFRKIIFTVN
jgi:hypothetical protein